MPDNTPRPIDPAAKPDQTKSPKSKAELDEKDLKQVTGGAPTLSDITISKKIDPASP